MLFGLYSRLVSEQGLHSLLLSSPFVPVINRNDDARRLFPVTFVYAVQEKKAKANNGSGVFVCPSQPHYTFSPVLPVRLLQLCRAL